MTDRLIEDHRHTAPLLAPRPDEEEATGDHGARGDDIDALVADAIAGAGGAGGDPLREGPQPRG